MTAFAPPDSEPLRRPCVLQYALANQFPHLRELLDAIGEELLSTTWRDGRAGVLCRMIAEAAQRTEMDAGPIAGWPIETRHGFVGLITAALEKLEEREVRCLPAAGFYATSANPRWREAGINWLRSR